MEMSLLRAPSGRLRTPWRLLLAAVFLLIAGFAGSAFFLLADGLVFGFGDSVALVGTAAASGIATAVGVLIAARFLDHRPFPGFGLATDAEWWRDLAVGLALGGGLIAALYLAGVAFGVYRPRFAPAAPDGLTVIGGFALVTAFMIVVGFYEELVFRGYLLTNFAEGLTFRLDGRAAVVVAVALSSLGFAAVHGSNPNMSPLGVATIAVAGVALGLGYALTGRLALPIGFHITWNLSHFVFGLPVSGLDLGLRLFATERAGPALLHGGAVGPEGGLLGLGATLVGCLVILGYGLRVGDGFEDSLPAPPGGRDSE